MLNKKGMTIEQRVSRIQEGDTSFTQVSSHQASQFDEFEIELPFHSDEPYKCAFEMARDNYLSVSLGEDWAFPLFTFCGKLDNMEDMLETYGWDFS